MYQSTNLPIFWLTYLFGEFTRSRAKALFTASGYAVNIDRYKMTGKVRFQSQKVEWRKNCTNKVFQIFSNSAYSVSFRIKSYMLL